ncbi:class I SAM-dependent methyltransferase [Psychroserpens luteolus]|uniref:class I SAM-dependent methyltransferase n=1 Tax=Psychroserpens luteolus TaxID=2855840 RepID=UPI001E41CF8D|nr:class I SAM-dependent methyltransferase [Psychroserpens luteolus]MCD2257596.1 class I SAM-dependent methyltransferase [Psychroserpens luteolus]
MNQIYEQHLWGGKHIDFYSGEGSHDPEIVEPYLEAIVSFLKSHNNALTVCDLGCGDFNIGKQLTQFTNRYIAIDIVEDLIKRNKTKFKEDYLEFHCLDAAKDQLPLTDCIIIRQVLQHLSNAEIQTITKKLRHYKYIVLTEHIPTGRFTPNKDIISGQGIRLKHNSGVDLLKAPFNLKVVRQSVLNTIVLNENRSQIVTRLFITNLTQQP